MILQFIILTCSVLAGLYSNPKYSAGNYVGFTWDLLVSLGPLGANKKLYGIIYTHKSAHK